MESAPPATTAIDPEGPASRFARRVGLVILVLASFLPYHGCRKHPSQYDPAAKNVIGTNPDCDSYVAAARVEYQVRVLFEPEAGLQQRLVLGTFGETNDYGFVIFFAMPPWLLLLWLSWRKGGRDRRAVGLLLWVLSAALPPALALALCWDSGSNVDFYPHASPWIAWPLGAVAGLFLAWRPRGRRKREDVGATLSTHALIALAVVLARPTMDLFQWHFRDSYSYGHIALTMVHNYRIGFYLTVPALCLVAAPLYFDEESFRGLYDRCRPWRPRSSTPTPTSTSTGSTPTGTPSSNAPAGPGSSPS